MFNRIIPVITTGAKIAGGAAAAEIGKRAGGAIWDNVANRFPLFPAPQTGTPIATPTSESKAANRSTVNKPR